MTVLAKLTRPKLHQVVRRDRLFERLDECRKRPLAWVYGPPGAGKTALVASYVDARRIGGVWYHVDPGDRDLATFFHYLSEAAEGASRKRASPLPRLGAEHRGDLPGFARLYFRELFARLKRPAAIVLDNYHELPPQCELHALLETIVREMPDGIWLAAISRAEPPGQCAALRAMDRIALLEWDDLRLTFEEARSIAALRHSLDDATLRIAHEQAGGWPVGLTLVLERLKRFGGNVVDAQDEGREVLFNYFAGQIFASLASGERTALMIAALLPRASALHAERLCGDGAGALLERLYRRRMFVERRGEAYQFHDLFRAFLLQQFEHSYTPDRKRALRCSAVRLLQESGQMEDAFALACHSQDWDTATELLLAFAPMLYEQGRGPTLREWLAALPPQRVESTPWLGLWLGVALSGLSPAQGRAQFVRMFDRFAAGKEDMPRLLCCGGVLMTHYLEFDNLEQLDHWIEKTLPLLAVCDQLPGPTPELRVQSALLYALSFRRPQPDLLETCIARIHELLLAGCPVNARVDAAQLLLVHHSNSADLAAAERVAAMVEPWLSDRGLTPFYRALWWMQAGHHRMRYGELALAVEAYERALSIARDNSLTLPVINVSCHHGLANVAVCRGDADAAEAACARAAPHLTQARRIASGVDAGVRAAIAALRGDIDAALALARRQLELVDDVGIIWHRFYSRIALAFLLVENGEPGEVAGLLAGARELVHATSYAPLTYQAELIEAYSALLRHDDALARAKLAQALGASRGDPGKFLPRLLAGLLPRLLAFALEAGVDTDYVRRTIRQFGIRPPRADAVDWPWPLEIRTFGTFEVLRDGKPLEFSRKVPRKTLALLKAIVTFGGSDVSEQRLIDTFWADEEGDAAARSLDATVLRLRNLLGDAAAVVQQGGKLSLDRERVWVDVTAFEQSLSAAEGAARRHEATARDHWTRAFALYRGAFLAGDDGEAWPVALRERLRGRFIHALVAFGQELEHSGEYEAAIGTYQRGLEADPVVEPFYQGLMRCYGRLDRRSEAISAYRRLKQILSITLGLAPSAATEKLYLSLR